MARTYQFSPFGVAVHPWVNKPDVKFNADGVFKTGLRVTGPEAVTFKEAIDKAAEEAFAEFMTQFEEAGMKPAERKKWALYVPYEAEEDDDGNPTGAIVFDFKQNAKIKLKDGTVKEVSIAIKDAKNNDMHKAVFPGSIIRTMFAFRPIKMTSAKEAGVRMDFCAVQVKQLAKGSGGGANFGEVEGYVEEDDESPAPHFSETKDSGGDY